MASKDKQSNRDRYPQIARAVDELRQVFGDVKVTSLDTDQEKKDSQ